MTDIPSAPIVDFENTLSFPCEETSLDSGLPSHLPLGDVPCPSSPPYGFLHHTIRSLNSGLCFHALTEIRMSTRKEKRMKKRLFIVAFLILLGIPLMIHAQAEEFISYKVDDLEFHLTDVKLEFHPDEQYIHIEGIKTIKADLGAGHFPRHQNCESGITIEFFKQGETFVGTFQGQSSDVIPVYVSWCLMRQEEGSSKKTIQNFLASLDSGEDVMNFSLTIIEFGPVNSLVKGTFNGKLLDEDGVLHNIRDGKFQILRVDVH
jgi:hypothetical protein